MRLEIWYFYVLADKRIHTVYWGLFVVNDDDPKYTEKDRTPDFYLSMGFSCIDDYNRSYPGKYLCSSKIVSILEGALDRFSKSKLIPESTYDNVNRYIERDWETAYADIVNRSFYKNTIWFAVPTVKEVKSCKDMVGKLEYKNMWFCSDWKEK